jgi:hypothetical protein
MSNTMLNPTLIRAIPKGANVETMAITVKIVVRLQWNKFIMCIIRSAANHGIVFQWDIQEVIYQTEKEKDRLPLIPMQAIWVSPLFYDTHKVFTHFTSFSTHVMSMY